MVVMCVVCVSVLGSASVIGIVLVSELCYRVLLCCVVCGVFVCDVVCVGLCGLCVFRVVCCVCWCVMCGCVVFVL